MQAMDLEKLVVQPTWRDMLVDLVIEEKLDPWNIDILEVTEKYMDRIRKIQSLDLRIPANIILAASLLLRYKSESLKLKEDAPPEGEGAFAAEEGAPYEIPSLSLKTRIPPKRRVSLNELIGALSDVIESQKRRAERVFAPKPIMSIEVPKEDIEARMNKLLDRVKREADAEGVLLFSDLLESRTCEEMVAILLPILHLAQDRFLDIAQEKMFGEIFITVLEGKDANRAKANN